jgi:hypothetical protein
MTSISSFLDSNSAKARVRGLLDLGEILIDGDIDPNGAINAQTIRAAINKLPRRARCVALQKCSGWEFRRVDPD